MKRTEKRLDQFKGLSAAQAGRTDRRAASARPVAVLTSYTVYDECSQFTGTFADIQALCPAVNKSTLRARLDGGKRSLVDLRRGPANTNGATR